MQSSPLLKRKKKIEQHHTCDRPCIVCDLPCDEKIKNLSYEHWDDFKELAEEWERVGGKYSHVYKRIDWEKSADNHQYYWHKNCKWKMANKKTLLQATTTFNKSNSLLSISSISSNDDSFVTPVTRQVTGIVHDKDVCIWCSKGVDEKHPELNDFRVMEQMETWLKFKASVIHITDPVMKNRLTTFVDATTDPLAAKVRYHLRCFLKYLNPIYHPKKDEHLQGMTHSDIQKKFLHCVYQSIFEEGESRTLSNLTTEYERIRLDFGITSVVRSSTVKKLLEKEFGSKIGFYDGYHKNKGTIVFNCNGTGSYIESGINFWGIKTEDILDAAAKRIKEDLQGADQFPWPPKLSDVMNLQERATSEPNVVETFLSNLLTPTNKAKHRAKIFFLSDAIKYLVTGKRTQLLTALSIVLHGLSRNKEIAKLLQSAGVGISPDDIYTLYDTWAFDDFVDNPKCPEELCEGKPGTAIIDNDDFKDDDLTGGTTSHRTNMMFIQPMKFIPTDDGERPVKRLKRCSKGELKSIVEKENEISSSYKKNARGEPNNFVTVDTSPSNTHYIRKKMAVHAIVRCNNDGSDRLPEEQTIGAFSGFMNSISDSEDRSKAYYHATLPKSPSKKVVYTLMEKAVAAAECKKMPFIQFVGDQPVYAFVEELKSENPDKFKKILPVLGAFHTQCAFMSAILKRFKGSGIEDILVSAGLIVEGSVEQALKGKHYNRAQRLYKLLYEALIRHLLRCGENNGQRLPTTLRYFIDVIGSTEVDSADRVLCLEMLLEDKEFDAFITNLFQNVQGDGTDLAKFIISLMEMIEVLFMNIDSIRCHDWKRYLESLRLMMPWMLIYDNNNYGRWLPVYWLRMKSLSDEDAKHMPDIFAQSMTENSYSALPPDMWIECTMNKGSKLKSGWKRILKNEKGLFCHIRNANNINAIRNSLANFFCELRNNHIHKENVKSRLQTDEKAVQSLLSLFDDWQCDPFDMSCQELRSLHSGMLSSDELLKDLESAHDDGEALLDLAFKERLYSDKKSVFDRTTRNKRLNFEKMVQKHAKNVKEGSAAMESHAIVSVIELARTGNPDMFKEIWKHRICDHCLSVFHHNGSIRKCQKSKVVEMLTFTEICPQSYIAICDMGFLWHKTAPTADDRDKEDETPYTWGDYANQLYNVILSRHRNAKTLILVNDYYGSDVINIKDGEHANRSKKFMGGESQNVHPVASNVFPSINQFKDFFRNKGNKRRLQDFLRQEFTKRAQGDRLAVFYCSRNRCDNLASVTSQQCQQFLCDHIEADTAMLYIYSEIRNHGDDSPVVIDAEDTDVVALSAYAAHKIDGLLAIKRKKGIFDCKKLCDPSFAEIILRYHVMTGCDTVSSFHGIGKKSVWKNVAKHEEARSLLKNFTDDALRKFVIRFIYNDKGSESLAEMREKRWKKMKNKSIARAGIDEDTFLLRNKRVRYQASLLENFEQTQSDASPVLNGGYSRDGDVCVPIRYSKPSLPDNLNVPPQGDEADDKIDHERTDEGDIENEDGDGNCSGTDIDSDTDI